MDLNLFVRGLIIGFSIAAPVGPIGILCIRRTLAQGRAAGLVSGLGAATADAFYGAVAGLGLTMISTFLIDQQGWVRLLGGGFLCYLGVRTFLARPAEQVAPVRDEGLAGAYFSTLLLTLTNPLTILSFAAIFAGLGLGATEKDYFAALILVTGVFSGSAAWWLLLSGGISLLRQRFDRRAMQWVNRISGLVILGFGLAALASMVGRLGG